MHEGDSSLIQFNKESGMCAILAIVIKAWQYNIINSTHLISKD